MQLDATSQHEEASTNVISDEELTLASLDQAFEKRYEVTIGELPPSRFRILFGRTGRYVITVSFLQFNVSERDARGLLRSLGSRVQALALSQ